MLKPADRRFFAFWLVSVLAAACVSFGLMVPLLALMLAYTVMTSIGNGMAQRIGKGQGRALGVLAIVSVAILLFAMVIMGVHALWSNAGDLQQLLLQLGGIVETAKTRLPPQVAENIPQQQELFGVVGKLLREHAATLGALGLVTFKQLGYMLIGLLIGVLMALDESCGSFVGQRLSADMFLQCGEFRSAFSRIALAQVKISAVNTTLTTLYLLVVLPLFGVHIPFAKTLVLVTFVGGLIPIVGNLISNSIITVLSLSISFSVAIASLGFLVVVHKLEYFINARIVGSQTKCTAWEILLAMIVTERLLGLPGVVVAPILYSWMKQEWKHWELAH